MPLGPIYFNICCIFTIVGVWMIITYHHTKPEPIGCLGCWEKAGPLYFNIGPWGPHTSNYGAYLPLWVCGWSLPTTISNQSHVAALVAEKKRALDINIYGPLGPSTFVSVPKMVIHFHSCIMPHTCVKFGPWAYFSFWSTRGAKKFALVPLGPLTFVLGAKMEVSFHPCNMSHKCAKFEPWGYFTF